MKWKVLSGSGSKGSNMVARTMLAMWGLLKMGRPEAQIQYGGVEKIQGSDPSWILLHRW